MPELPDTRKNPDPDRGGAWAETPLNERVRWLRGFRGRLFDATDELAALMAEEVGKPLHEAVTGDLLPLLASCKWHEKHAGRLLKAQRPRGTPLWMIVQRHRVVSVPLGHVGIIATWNYPVQLLGIQMIQALVAGNRVTVKPSERSPRTQRRLVELASVGLPVGTLSAWDSDREAGARMLETETFDYIVFTGSTAVGRSIARTLAESLTPSTLELSGRDSVLLLDDADTDLAADRIWNLVTMNCGQTCMAPRRVLADEKVYDRLRDSLRRNAPEGVREIIDERSAAEVRKLTEAAAAEGAEIIPAPASETGRSVTARIAMGVDAGSELVAGDHFGPLCAVVRCSGEEEMLRIHRACSQHLATSVFSADRERVNRLIPHLKAGTVVHNDVVLPTAHPGVSIRGHRDSGWGASRGEDGLRSMVQRVHVASVPRRLRAPAGQPGEKQLAQLRGIMKFLYGRGPRS